MACKFIPWESCICCNKFFFADDKNRLTEDLRRLTEKQAEDGGSSLPHFTATHHPDLHLVLGTTGQTQGNNSEQSINQQIASLLPDDLKGLASQFAEDIKLPLSNSSAAVTKKDPSLASNILNQDKHSTKINDKSSTKPSSLHQQDLLKEELNRLSLGGTGGVVGGAPSSHLQADELRRLASQLPADELKKLTGRLHDDLKKLNFQQQQQEQQHHHHQQQKHQHKHQQQQQ